MIITHNFPNMPSLLHHPQNHHIQVGFPSSSSSHQNFERSKMKLQKKYALWRRVPKTHTHSLCSHTVWIIQIKFYFVFTFLITAGATGHHHPNPTAKTDSDWLRCVRYAGTTRMSCLVLADGLPVARTVFRVESTARVDVDNDHSRATIHGRGTTHWKRLTGWMAVKFWWMFREIC